MPPMRKIMPMNHERVMRNAGTYGKLKIVDHENEVVCLFNGVRVLSYDRPHDQYDQEAGNYILGPTNPIRDMERIHYYLNRALVLMGCPGQILNQGTSKDDTSGYWWDNPWVDRNRHAPHDRQRDLRWTYNYRYTIDNAERIIVKEEHFTWEELKKLGST